jgi:hypothetical protein
VRRVKKLPGTSALVVAHSEQEEVVEMKDNVYIVTRDRLDNLEKIIPRWLEQYFYVTLVIEHSEYMKHDALIRGMGVYDDIAIISPKAENKGIGHARKYAVTNACLRGLRSFIMSDDDLRPHKDSVMADLVKEAEKPNVLGIGATRPLHDRFSHNMTRDRDDVIICPGGWGMQVFALNVRNTVDVGNFNPRLDCWGEDHELMRDGIVCGFPWLVHCGVKCEPIGVRYDPGGLHSYIGKGNRSERELECRKLIYERWGNYVSKPDKRPRTAWARMMDEYIPNWRSKSAIHGGEWQ